MYVQSNESKSVQDWVDTVQGLRYKDYQLVAPTEKAETPSSLGEFGTLEEVATVKEMGAKMEGADMFGWWRKAMGFSSVP